MMAFPLALAKFMLFDDSFKLAISQAM